MTTAYTPLETLLLFQALRCEGVNSHAVFNRISDQLKDVQLVRTDPSYDSGRLSPDALRELYLWLLKEEVKRDVEEGFDRENGLQNGDLSPGSRKRKAPSPSLPTVHEASQHAHLIPQLVARLYARYREQTVRQIREHERQYDALSKEISEIEAGKWDERLQRQKTASATQSPRPSPFSHTQPAPSKQDNVHHLKSSIASPASPRTPVEGNGQSQRRFTENKIDALINHEPEPQDRPKNHRRSSSTTTLPPLSEMAPQSPHFGIPPTIPHPSHQSQMQGFNQSPTSAQHSPFASHHAHPSANSMTSPQLQNSLSRPSSSPRPILPPPPGMKLPPPSPGHQIGSPSLHGPPLQSQQQYTQQPPHRLSSVPSPASEYPPRGYPQTQLPQGSQGYYQQQTQPDRRSSYPPQQVGTPNAYGGLLNQPGAGYQYGHFQPDGRPTNAHMMQQQGQFAQQQYPNAPSTAPQPVRPPPNRLVSDIIAALATPPRQSRSPVWKSERRPTPLKLGAPVPRPEPEPLSPVLKRSETVGGRPARSTRGRSRRDRSPLSVVSSTADDSARLTRSHSVSTAAGAVPTLSDRPGSRGNVKIEPSTPAGFADEPETSHEVPSGGRTTRKRRGTQLNAQPSVKRQRQQFSPSAGDEARDPYTEDMSTPPPRSTTVMATRNFHKTSSTIMNDINSHKHASYFAREVRDKDAPGYSEIIKQPQHLKSIRAAITAGTKAVNSATAALDSPPASAVAADNSTSVELERTADLIPPKAIVNAAQLEKEVMRMFANAVMFNPGEDGMVADTKEMFENIDAQMRDWRGAEKLETAEFEEMEEVKGKRRRL